MRRTGARGRAVGRVGAMAWVVVLAGAGLGVESASRAEGPEARELSATGDPAERVEQGQISRGGVLRAEWDTDGPRVRQQFAPAVAAAGRSTLELRRGGRRVALATVVDPRGYLLSKASELRASADDPAAPARGLSAALGNAPDEPAAGPGVAVAWVAEDRGTDLVLLRLVGDPPAGAAQRGAAQRGGAQRGGAAVRWSEVAEPAAVGGWVVVPSGHAASERGGGGGEVDSTARGVAAVGIVSAATRQVAGVRLGVQLVDVAVDRLPTEVVTRLIEYHAATAESILENQNPEDPALPKVDADAADANVDMRAGGGVAMITGLVPGMGAAEAGLRGRDLILRIGDAAVADAGDVIDAVQLLNAGQRVPVTVLRWSDTPAVQTADGGDEGKSQNGDPGEAEGVDEAEGGEGGGGGEGVRVIEVEVEMRLRPDDLRSRADRMNTMGNDRSRRRDGFAAVFQHDALVDPDQCGGPVLDLDGRALGINIARAGRVEMLALPADAVRAVLADWQAAGVME